MANRKSGSSADWDRTHLTARKAHGKVAYQVRLGRLEPRPCEVCGWSLALAHHDDYAKPMEVRWLCHAHHREWHKLHPVPAEAYVPPRFRGTPPGERRPNRGRAFRRYLKPRALRMREAGCTYLEIAVELGISTSTAHGWC